MDYINRESARLSRLSEKMMELTRLYEPESGILLQKVSIETLFTTVEENVKHRLEENHMILEREGTYKDLENFCKYSFRCKGFVNNAQPLSIHEIFVPFKTSLSIFISA